MATLYQIPLAVTNRHMPVPFGPDHQVVVDFVNLVGEKRFGQKHFKALPDAQRELIYDYMFELLRDLDELERES